MRNPLSLSAYLTWARRAYRATDHGVAVSQARGGPLVWAHGQTSADMQALGDICARLTVQRPELDIWFSQDNTGDMAHEVLPSEHPNGCDSFAQALRPDIVVWSGGMLRPAVLDAVATKGARLIGVNIPEGGWTTGAPRWIPDPASALVPRFTRLFAQNTKARRQLLRYGARRDQLGELGVLQASPVPPGCPIALHEEMVEHMAARPMWLAAELCADELHDILQAHRTALRMAHRLLLIVVPASQKGGAQIRRALEAQETLRVCYWDNGELPDENTQVLLAEDPGEIGLWYRLSPVAFVGGSMVSGHGGRAPYAAAALGSAVLYGPHVSEHLAAYSRLNAAGAARLARDANALGAAVVAAMAPDQAASMAHAGWDVVTSGAHLADAVVADVMALLDAAEAG